MSVRFIIRIPTMLSSGNSAGTIKSAFSPVVSLIVGKVKAVPLSPIYATIAKIRVAMLNEMSRGIVDRGLE